MINVAMVAPSLGSLSSPVSAPRCSGKTAAGVSQPVINEAKRTGRIGPKLALGTDAATGGEISKANLRPDLWGNPAPANAEATQ